MSIRVALRHTTRYEFDRPTTLSPHIVRLRPAPHCRTPIESYSLRITPGDHFLNWQQDPQSNYLARLVFNETTRQFIVDVDLIADMKVINPFEFFISPEAETYPFSYQPWLAEEIAPFRKQLAAGPVFESYLNGIDRGETKTIDFVVELNRRLQQDISYVIRMEPGVQTPEETLKLRKGSCRDSSWLLVQLLRHLGLAARFVSGYLIQLVPDVKPLDGPAGPDEDFTDLHAWTEVYLPGAGWVGLDPTSGLLAGEGHLPLACTPEPGSAAPITGSTSKSEVEFSHEMKVTRIEEDPRVTKPYTATQWQAIDALGRAIDEELESADVRLTMGGEPTFVSIDDMDGEEWNYTADSPCKRRLAGQLVRRLKNQFAPGGFLHFGQGKWYPGEQLPRWSLGCYWRRDGEPIWLNPEMIAEDETDYGHDEHDAERFARALAERLGVEERYAIPGYEDVWYYLWKERRLPENVDPFDTRLEDPQERARLAQVFEQGLNKVVGYVLPLRRGFGYENAPWVTGPWFFRAERMYLFPGDSPMGYRLPLDSLPWLAESDDLEVHAQDVTEARSPLPRRAAAARQMEYARQPGTDRGDARRQVPPLMEQSLGEGEGDGFRSGYAGDTGPSTLVRTALCTQARGGRIHVFMPPVRTLEHYLELVAAVEDTAERLSVPVHVEGYTPPHDHRVNQFKVTPDPGVIEVNIQPSSNWDELVHNTETLYEEARLSRLGTEKFMLDGRHTGTGGGNHVVIGAPTPLDSPILRRPDLLKSLIGYWHNHPSLSYLFSSVFIGPTSQAPRMEEARSDMLHEMEIAFQQIPDEGGCAPWLVDRVFRHLLVDVTGNTHRAEFCIDKLYSPEGGSGRLGLVEFRAFEMPPHARMSLTQQLLLRALIARFWKKPYRASLVRWGSELHDRFMLPHYVAKDFEDVLIELQNDGYPIKPEWFASHFEFRFPIHGKVAYRDTEIELRQAIEPWYTLGEEATAAGTSRYVDSSVERLQVKVRGAVNARHIVTCNGRRVPLHPTGANGEFVAGVRYRAWQPPSCLHPTIGVHTPLVFDLLDTWLERSLGGCRYHVSHPGGRGFEIFPVNALEAESRRNARFERTGHTPGGMMIPPVERSDHFPHTLDMRRLSERLI